jgi:hypothetical protein
VPEVPVATTTNPLVKPDADSVHPAEPLAAMVRPEVGNWLVMLQVAPPVVWSVIETVPP